MQGEVASCANCGRASGAQLKLQACAACKAVQYCSKECQRVSWNGGHKAQCRMLQQPEAGAAEAESQAVETESASQNLLASSMAHAFNTDSLQKPLDAADAKIISEANALIQLVQKHKNACDYERIIALGNKTLRIAASLATRPRARAQKMPCDVCNEPDGPGSSWNLYDCLDCLGWAYECRSMWVECMVLQKEIRLRWQKSEDAKGQIQAIKWLNNTLDRQGLFEEWLAFSQERLEIIQREGWSVSVEACRALADLGSVYTKLGRLSEATHAHVKQVDTARKLGNSLKEEGLVFEADGLFRLARAAAAFSQGGCCPFRTADNYKRAIEVLSQCKTSGRKQFNLSSYYFQLGLHNSGMIQITQRYKFRMQKETGCTGAEENVFAVLSAEERALAVKRYAGGRVSGLDAAGAPTVTVSLRENLQVFQTGLKILEEDTEKSTISTTFNRHLKLQIARLVYMLGDEDEAVSLMELFLEEIVSLSRTMCAGCEQARGNVSMLNCTCSKCGVARYCNKEHQKMAENGNIGRKITGVTRFSAHKYLCSSLKLFKNVSKGKQQSESCRKEILGLLRAMKNWIPPMPSALDHRRQLVVGATVEIHATVPCQGNLVRYLGTWQEFNSNSTTASWKVQKAATSEFLQLEESKLTFIRGPPDEEDEWWELVDRDSRQDETAGEASIEKREQGKLMVWDIVQLHSLTTGPYNGQYGTLGNYSEEKERWQVKLEKQDKVIFVKNANLTFIREPRIKSLPGSLEVKSVLVRLGELWKKQDAKGVLDMEKEARQAARSLLLPTSDQEDRANLAQIIYYYLGAANLHLGHYDKAIDIFQQQVVLWFFNSFLIVVLHLALQYLLDIPALFLGMTRKERARAQLSICQEFGLELNTGMSLANLGNAHLLKKEYRKAIDFILQAQAIFREKGNQVSEARTFNTLYTIYTLLGQHSQAQLYLEKHLTIQAQICAANPSNPTALMDCLEEGNMFGMQPGVCVHVRPYSRT